MKKFIIYVVVFTIPFICILCLYCILDPYKVIKKYDIYIESGKYGDIIPNIDYVSTSMFDKNNDKERYDSFILGNSRSIFYEIDTWNKYIGNDNSCYHFDASGESIYGMYLKVKHINNSGNKIKNCLFVIDYSTLSKTEPHKGVIGMKSPILENNKTLFKFHKTTFLACIKLEFIVNYILFKVFNKIENNPIVDTRIRDYDAITNELRFLDFENTIEKNPLSFYSCEKIKVFYERDSIQKYSDKVIKEKQLEYLTYIKNVFDSHKTNYKIIISPLYDQKKINTTDIQQLNIIFGKGNVFDFSGINEMTQDYHNYYENSHYRPHVAAEIMSIIYQDTMRR